MGTRHAGQTGQEGLQPTVYHRVDCDFLSSYVLNRDLDILVSRLPGDFQNNH